MVSSVYITRRSFPYTHSALTPNSEYSLSPGISPPGDRDTPQSLLQSNPAPDTLPAQHPAAPGPH